MGSNTQDPYGSSTESPERAYLSRLQALAVNTGLRGKMNGTETVDQLFALLFEPPEGKEAAERFMEDHVAGNFIKGRYRTDVPPVPPTPADLFQ